MIFRALLHEITFSTWRSVFSAKSGPCYAVVQKSLRYFVVGPLRLFPCLILQRVVTDSLRRIDLGSPK
ncbi:hypothetical protein VTO42DRAFT_3715 [Malbranchea cinnamomea]